jgi:ATP-dependent helicase/nuclease subunit A
LGVSGLYINGKAADASTFYGTAGDPAANVVVSACAGSGKTWLLAARVIRLLLAGAPPESIVAITFTKKAAAEMQRRIFEWLEELATLTEPAAIHARLLQFYVPQTQLADAAGVAPGLLARVLRAPQPLEVRTFHSWFARLRAALPLTEFAAINSEMPATPALLEADAWERFLQLIGQDSTATQCYVEFVAQLGLEASKAALMTFIDRRVEWLSFCESATDTPQYALNDLRALHADTLAYTPEQFLKVHRADLLALAALFAKDSGKRAESASLGLANALDPACLPEQLAAFLSQALLTGQEELNGNLTGLKILKHDPVALSCYERTAQAVMRLRERERAQKLLALHAAWYRLGDLLVAAYEQEKATQNVADYADLELDIARVLQDESAASSLQARLDTRVAHLLVDEFQDTNPVQWRILRGWLAGYAQQTDKPSVFIVGDAKQSIYRFRRADPEIFAAATTFFQQNFAAQILTTQQTRRNGVAVNAFVNRMFVDAAGPWADAAQVDGPFAPQVTLQEEPGSVEVLELTAVGDAAEPPSMDRNPLTTPLFADEEPALLAQARQLVHRLMTRKREAEAAAGAFAWAEVLVLVRKRAQIQAVETALREAAIAYESSRRGGLLQAPEVADIQALCTALATPQADLALAQVLRSPLFGFTDADLIALWPQAPALRGWNALRDSAQEHHQRALACLELWRQWSGALPVHDLLDRIYAQHDVVRRYAAITPGPRRAAAVGNLSRVLELALDAHGGRFPSLSRFVQALESFERVEEDDMPDEAAPTARDSVLITTVHSAKGLERDVVVLFDAHRNWRKAGGGDSRTLIVWPAGADRPAHFSYDFGRSTRTSARAHWEAEEDRRERIEQGALLYVAVTRARRHLIVCGSAAGRLTQKPTWWEVCAQAQPAVPWPQAAAMQADPHSNDTGAATYHDTPLQAVPWQPAENQDAGPAAVHGTVWHALIEQLSQAAADSRVRMREPLCQALVLRYKLPPHEVATLHDEALHLMAQPHVAPLFAADVPAQVEWAVVDAQGNQLRMDRVVQLETATWIVDFKRVQHDVDAAQLPVEYGAQLHRYAQTLQALEPNTAVRCAVLTQHAQIFEWDLAAQRFQARAGLH